MDQYNRERRTYNVPSISKSPYIRALLDDISPNIDRKKVEADGGEDNSPVVSGEQLQSMVFEWMDTDLWQLPSKPFRPSSVMPRIVARSVLEALVVLASEDGVHADVNPNNIFVSNAESNTPIVKLGDLGVGKFDPRSFGVC